MVTMLEVSCRRDLQAATGAGFIGAGGVRIFVFEAYHDDTKE